MSQMQEVDEEKGRLSGEACCKPNPYPLDLWEFSNSYNKI
jgi:hypothetical protein